MRLVFRYFFIFLLTMGFVGSVRVPETKIPNYNIVQTEKLNRGFIAVHQGNGEVSLAWRIFSTDTSDVSFDIYRYSPGKASVKINHSPISFASYFIDKNVDTAVDQIYTLFVHGKKKKIATYSLSVEKAQKPYISIPLVPLTFENASLYQPNDASVGDLDGDGELEIIIKRIGAFFACSQAGMSPGGIILEAYKLNGERLWQIDVGKNIRQGAQYFQFLVADFDGDGKSEVAIKTSEGTRFGDGKIIGDTNEDGITDYINYDKSSRMYGKILSGPEYFSVVEGITGKELARGPYIERGNVEDWGDNYGNRVDRQLGAIGYFDGKTPCIFWGRGYNGKSVMHAWTFRKGKLTRLWEFDTSKDSRFKEYENQGNHNISIGDVDGDGKDEVMYGACAIDHNGQPMYSTKLGHGDAMHLTDIDPSRPGLELWQCHEYAPNPAGSSLRDARTGELLVQIPSIKDVGRCLAADIDPRFPGLELWSSESGGVISVKGELISSKTPSINMAVWWDGDLNRELLDGVRISKWNGSGVDVLFDGKDNGILSNNGTKANPCLVADILGDWREEVIWRSADNNEIRIYLTPHSTAYRFPTFLEDVIYRNSVAAQNVGYNQPTQPGFYFGSDKDEQMEKLFTKLEKLDWKVQFVDIGKSDWRKNWFLDGKKGEVSNSVEGMRFKAGSDLGKDADHAVLWTKNSFKGNLKIDYEFIRLDSLNRFVNIIFIQAEGEGSVPFEKDINLWSNLRDIPAMKMYFNHMNTLHISYAAYENSENTQENQSYIRARRYMPSEKQGLNNTNLQLEYLSPMQFFTNEKHQISIIKYDTFLLMRVISKGQKRYYFFDADSFPPINSGRIGLRQMSGRESLYSNFTVSTF